MKPTYCNTASITNNQKTGEVTLSFSQVYNEHKMSIVGGALTDASMPVVCEEACVVMSRGSFMALKKLVDEIAGQIEARENG